MEPEQRLRSAVEPPIPAPVWTPHALPRSFYQRRRSWPIPPANCAEAAHDRRKCVIRTGDKSLLSRPVCFKHLLVLGLPIMAPKGCEIKQALLRLFPSLRLCSLANIQPFRESLNVACLGST
ncbi:uncharacterized protein TrAtP1_008504 [Trichoderma atroviride]|uniref:uncharacterized protein n=1 Tax=Hypocrea atroviridis TaxID=63577 RepID=UPI0033176C2E|nr:hypothetical protein TrAtP1_008504 [Trichoderma atroviride]